MRLMLLCSDTKYIITATATNSRPTITHAKATLQINSPSHNASAIVRAKAPTIMAHTNSTNDTASNSLVVTLHNHTPQPHSRSDYGALYPAPRSTLCVSYHEVLVPTAE